MIHTQASAARDRRAELVALWRALAARSAAVTWHDLDALPDDVVDTLRTSEARRLRVLAEGEAAGWTPAWRTTQRHGARRLEVSP